MSRIYEIRYEVYCLEKKFLDASRYPDGLERDEYDSHSVHFVAVETDGGDEEILGTLRLIRFSELGFPVTRHFKLFKPINDPARAHELSRLIVIQHARRMSVHILMGLCKVVYLYAREYGVDDLYAVLESSVLRLLTKMKLPFEEAGRRIWYMGGDCAPVYLSVANAERVLGEQNAFFLAYLQEEQVSWL
jgi:N-acyl-L-homoserine lactone synthetase